MEELLDVYTRDGEYLGVQPRELFVKGNPGFYNKPAWTWVYNSKNEVLVQKRASTKKVYPDYWDMSCAGHIDAGESVIQGVMREAKEEIGIDVKEEDCEFKFEFIEDNLGELGQVYFIKVDKDINDFIIQEEEVAEIKWVSLDELREMLYSDKWCPYSKEYKEKVLEEFEKTFK